MVLQLRSRYLELLLGCLIEVLALIVFCFLIAEELSGDARIRVDRPDRVSVNAIP